MSHGKQKEAAAALDRMASVNPEFGRSSDFILASAALWQDVGDVDATIRCFESGNQTNLDICLAYGKFLHQNQMREKANELYKNYV